MKNKEILQITDIETIKLKYQEILGERIHTDGSHPLYLRGLFDGMEVFIAALSQSMQDRKRIEDQNTP